MKEIPPTLCLLPAAEAKLSRYMHDNPQETDHYRRMVKENPAHAVKTIMCQKMVQHEELRELAVRLQPLVKEWISQTPGLHNRIMEKIKDVSPLNSNVAYVEEALRAKAPLVLSPFDARSGARMSTS
jgi:hypothetical protein